VSPTFQRIEADKEVPMIRLLRGVVLAMALTPLLPVLVPAAPPPNPDPQLSE